MSNDVSIVIKADASPARKEISALSRGVQDLNHKGRTSSNGSALDRGNKNINAGAASRSSGEERCSSDPMLESSRLIASSNQRLASKIDALTRAISSGSGSRRVRDSTPSVLSTGRANSSNIQSGGQQNPNQASFARLFGNLFRTRGGSGQGNNTAPSPLLGGDPNNQQGAGGGKMLGDVLSTIGPALKMLGLGGSAAGATGAAAGAAGAAMGGASLLAALGPMTAAVGAVGAAVKGMASASSSTLKSDRKAFEIYNKTDMFGTDTKSGKRYAQEIGASYGMKSEQTMDVQKAYMAQAGFQGKDKLTSDTHEVLDLAKNYGMDAGSLASSMGSMAKSGVVSDQNRFANMLATNIKKQGMEGREEEVVRSLGDMSDYLKSNLVEINQGQIENMNELHNILASSNAAFKGERGSEMVKDLGEAMKGSGVGELASRELAREQLGENASEIEVRTLSKKIQEEGMANEDYRAATLQKVQERAQTLAGSGASESEIRAWVTEQLAQLGMSYSEGEALAKAMPKMTKVSREKEDYSEGASDRYNKRSNYTASNLYARDRASNLGTSLKYWAGDMGTSLVDKVVAPVATADVALTGLSRISRGQALSSRGWGPSLLDAGSMLTGAVSSIAAPIGTDRIAGAGSGGASYSDIIPDISQGESVLDKAKYLLTGNYSKTNQESLDAKRQWSVASIVNGFERPSPTDAQSYENVEKEESSMSNHVSPELNRSKLYNLDEYRSHYAKQSTRDNTNTTQNSFSSLGMAGDLVESNAIDATHKIARTKKGTAIGLPTDSLLKLSSTEQNGKGYANKQDSKQYSNFKAMFSSYGKMSDRYAELLEFESRLLDRRESIFKNAIGEKTTFDTADIFAGAVTSSNTEESKSGGFFSSIFGGLKNVFGGLFGNNGGGSFGGASGSYGSTVNSAYPTTSFSGNTVRAMDLGNGSSAAAYKGYSGFDYADGKQLKGDDSFAYWTSKMISEREGSYNTIVGDDNGGMSIGTNQMHNQHAHTLLNHIRRADPETYASIKAKYSNATFGKSGASGTTNMWDAIEGDGANFKKFTAHKSTAAHSALNELLSSEASKQVQERDMQDYTQFSIDRGRQFGLTDPKTLALYADAVNKFGWYDKTINNKVVSETIKNGGSAEDFLEAMKIRSPKYASGRGKAQLEKLQKAYFNKLSTGTSINNILNTEKSTNNTPSNTISDQEGKVEGSAIEKDYNVDITSRSTNGASYTSQSGHVLEYSNAKNSRSSGLKSETKPKKSVTQSETKAKASSVDKNALLMPKDDGIDAVFETPETIASDAVNKDKMANIEQEDVRRERDCQIANFNDYQRQKRIGSEQNSTSDNWEGTLRIEISGAIDGMGDKDRDLIVRTIISQMGIQGAKGNVLGSLGNSLKRQAQ